MTDYETLQESQTPEGELPEGWAWVTIQECCEILDNIRVPINSEEREQRISGKSKEQLYPYYGATGQVGWIDEFLFDDEIVLLGEDGAPFFEPHKHKAYLVRGRCWVNNHAHVLRSISGLTTNSYLCHYLNMFDYHGYVNGTTRLKLTQAQMKSIPVLLPPLSEQQHIVDTIESLFTQLDAGVAALKRLRANLKRYKAAVLKAACEGKLVPQDPNDEPAADLLKRILKERRAKWEAEQRAKGKDPRKLKYDEPAAPDTSDLPELPEGWVWASLDMIGDVRNGVTKGRKLDGKQTISVPYLRVANVQDGFLDLSEVKDIEIKADELEKYRLKPDDILFNEGGDRDKLGRGAIWHGEIEDCVHQNHVYAVRPYSGEILAEWINLVRQLDYSRDYFWRVASQTVNLASINATSLRSLPIPLASEKQQSEILIEIDQILSIVDEISIAINVDMKRAERLRQAILKQAFEGKLVPQDPNDESASELLKRVRRQRKGER